MAVKRAVKLVVKRVLGGLEWFCVVFSGFGCAWAMCGGSWVCLGVFLG